MSRIGKVPVNIPEKVEVSIANGLVTIKGVKGSLTHKLNENVIAMVDGKSIVVKPKDESAEARSQ